MTALKLFSSFLFICLFANPSFATDPIEFGYSLTTSDIRSIGTNSATLKLCPNGQCSWRTYTYTTDFAWHDESKVISRKTAIKINLSGDRRRHFAYVNHASNTLVNFSFGGLKSDAEDAEQQSISGAKQ